MLRFVEKKPRNGKKLIVKLIEDREQPPEDDSHAMNFSLIMDNGEDIADGRCSIMDESECDNFLYISAIYVNGNINYPTKDNPNKYVGMGQLMVFSAIKYGFELNVKRASLVPLDGSEGFYLKMGFHPQVIGNSNRMNLSDQTPISANGKLNKNWVNNFSRASFAHRDFRGPNWVGSIPQIYPQLRENILRSWDII